MGYVEVSADDHVFPIGDQRVAEGADGLAELEFVGESRAFGLAVGEIGVDEDEVAVFGSQDPTLAVELRNAEGAH